MADEIRFSPEYSEQRCRVPLVLKLRYPCGCGRRYHSSVRLTVLPEMPKQVFDRVCPRCGAEWTIEVTPLRQTPGYIMHRCEWTCTKGAK
jgi:hypothetical protein